MEEEALERELRDELLNELERSLSLCYTCKNRINKDKRHPVLLNCECLISLCEPCARLQVATT